MKNIRPFIVAAVVFLAVLQVAIISMGVPLGMNGRADFRHLYTAGYMVRTGHGNELYDFDANLRFQNQLVSRQDVALTFNHLAFEALLYVPLSILRFRSAYLVFLALNLALIFIIAQIAAPYLGHLRQEWQLLPVAVFVCFLPTAITLIQGQDSIILLSLMVLTAVALKNNRDILAGLLLALTLFKFQFAIIIILFLFAWRRWRTVGAFIVGCGVVVALSLVITGFSSPITYGRYLLAMSTNLGTSHQQFIYGIDPAQMPNIRGTVYGVLHSFIPNRGLQWITAVLSVLIILLNKLKRSFESAVLLSVICSYHCMIHDAIILLIPLLFLRANTELTKWICVVVFVSPAVLFLLNAPYWPLGLLLFAFMFCDREPTALDPVFAAAAA
jgi:Glycosyltransferase family 87